MITKYALSLLAIILIGAGCSSDNAIGPNSGATDTNLAINEIDNPGAIAESFFDGHHGLHREMTFVVRIENVSTASSLELSNGETAPVPHAPGVWTISRFPNTIFTAGRYDRDKGLEELAEDGNPARLAASLMANKYIESSGVFNTPVGDANPGPALPGKAYEFTVTASPGDRLSFATMFVQSNDLFYAPNGNGIPLFLRNRQPISGDVTRFIKLWDAGTEVNQEPGLGSDQAPRQSSPNTGETEHKRIYQIRNHRFLSLLSRDQFSYPSTEEIIKVTITPMEETSSPEEFSQEG